MLFKCVVVNKEIKNANKITLDIHIKDRQSDISKDFEIFLKPIRTKSIFHSYHNIGMVINAILYVSMIFLMIKIIQIYIQNQQSLEQFLQNQTLDDKELNNKIKYIKKIYNIVLILGFIIFFHSIILFNNILYLEYISGTFVNILFFIFLINIFSLISALISFLILKDLSIDIKESQKKVSIAVVKIAQIIAILTSSIIFLSMNLSIFMNVIHPTILLILFILISMLITAFLVYKLFPLLMMQIEIH